MKIFNCIATLLVPILADAPPNPFPDLPEGAKAETSFTMLLLNMFFTLGLLISVVLLASWALKKMMSSRVQQVNETSLIKIIEQRALTAKTVVSLIEIQGVELAIAESTNGVTVLTHFQTKEEEEK